jgi:hypothetical protein
MVALSLACGLAIAGTAAAQLDLTMALDLPCDGTPIWQVIGDPTPALVDQMCSGAQTTNGLAYPYAVTLATPQEMTFLVNSYPLQLTLLRSPYGPDNCVDHTPISVTPELTACLPAGEYVVLVSTVVEQPLTYAISATCVPCVPTPNEVRTWSWIKGMYE